VGVREDYELRDGAAPSALERCAISAVLHADPGAWLAVDAAPRSVILRVHLRTGRQSGWADVVAACRSLLTAALDPGNDPALQSFHGEGMRSLEILDLTRRVIATATALVALTR
jgi:hypothetical protein